MTISAEIGLSSRTRGAGGRRQFGPEPRIGSGRRAIFSGTPVTLRRLPQEEWVYGIPNARIVMAAFLHVSPAGMRYNGPELGAWYAAGDIRTTAAEVGHHLRREISARRPIIMRFLPLRYHAKSRFAG